MKYIVKQIEKKCKKIFCLEVWIKIPFNYFWISSDLIYLLTILLSLNPRFTKIVKSLNLEFSNLFFIVINTNSNFPFPISTKINSFLPVSPSCASTSTFCHCQMVVPAFSFSPFPIICYFLFLNIYLSIKIIIILF